MGIRDGLDAGYNAKNRTGGPPPTNSQSTSDYGVDVLFHMDGLTVLGEDRWDRLGNQADTGAAAATTHRNVAAIQAGYAFPLEDVTIEPAFRAEHITVLEPNTNAGDVYGANNQDDYGSNGRQYDFGVNFYWAGHAVKTQVAYTYWRGNSNPAGGSKTEAQASIFRLQQQIAF